MSITTSTSIHHASKVIVEAHTTTNRFGEETKWVTLMVKSAEGRKEMELTVFDLELADVFLIPNTQQESEHCGTFRVEYAEGGGYETEGE